MHIKPSLIIRPTWLPCVNVVKVQSHDFSKGFNPNDHYCSQHNNSLYWSGKAREFPIHWPSPLAGWQLHCLGSLHSASLWQFSAILPLPSQPINTTLNTDTPSTRPMPSSPGTNLPSGRTPTYSRAFIVSMCSACVASVPEHTTTR